MRQKLSGVVIPMLLIFTGRMLAQDKTAKMAKTAADSSGAARRFFTEFKAHAPKIDWSTMAIDLLWILLILLLAYIAARYLLQPLRVIAQKSKQHAATLTRSAFIIQSALWLMAFYLILFKVVRVSQITEAILGATIGLAILIANRDLLVNLLAGIRITMTKCPRAGDRLRLDDIRGVVEKAGLISTTIRRRDKLIAIIPNRLFMRQPVHELIAAESYMPVQIDFYFPAEGDFVRIREIAERAASLSKYIYLNNPISVDLENIFREGRSLVQMRVTARVLDAEYEHAFRSEISEQVLGEIFSQKLFTGDQLSF